jgi:hypothetical protein
VRRALVDLARLLRRGKPGGHLLDGSSASLSLQLDLPLDGGQEDTTLEEGLLAELDRCLDDEILRAAALRPGRVFCHGCSGADCGHARPPDPRSVFVGWTATGRPRWSEFAQLCLDRRHPEVDRLYDDPPAVLYHVQDPDELGLDLLPELRRSAPTRLLAQVCLGFFPADPADRRGSLRALTAQAVSPRRRRGAARVVLNLVGEEPPGDPSRRAGNQPLPWVGAARTAQGKLDTLARRATGKSGRTRAPELLSRGATAILAEFARRTAREARGRGRRTQHAQERHTSGERPTRTAIEDLRRASPGALMVDERSGALVVAGPRGRTHFFSLGNGRLVSSVRYEPGDLERKRRRGRWRPATPEEAAALRSRL